MVDPRIAHLTDGLEAIADGNGAPTGRTKGNGRATPVGEPWPTLGVVDVPPFPVAALPGDLRAWVGATAEATQTPPDVAAWAALAVLAAVAQGSGVVDCGKWMEQLGLYIAVALPTGDRKSAVMQAARAPLTHLEAERRDAARARVAKAEQERELREDRRKALSRKAAQHDDPDKRAALEAEAGQIAAELASMPPAVLPRFLADDATPEALAGILARHGRIAIIAAESAFLANAKGRYNTGEPNWNLVCSAFTGESATIDRRGRDAEFLPCPLLTLAFIVQPHVVRALAADEIARYQGLVARFVLVEPNSLVGARAIDAPSVPDDVQRRWAALVERFAMLHPADTTDTTPHTGSYVGSVSVSSPYTLTFDAEAAQRFRTLRAEIEPRLAANADLADLADWVNRHPGRVARIAALLHLVEHGINEPISEDVMARAIAIGDYTLAHAIGVLTGPPTAILHAARWLRRHGEPVVSQRDLQRGLFSRGTSDDAAKLAADLVAHGYLRPRETPPAAGKGGRKPSPTFDVHPHLRAETAA